MAQPFPYTYYSCDCYDSKSLHSSPAKRNSPNPSILEEDDEDERTFDPRSPRSNYSLFPLEHLLYCEDCKSIKCPRCVVEETSVWYCPSCLFEVPSSVVKSDGNRCTRNCYNCPVCTSSLQVSSLEDPDKSTTTGGPFILSCPYCHWSTAETGIEFEKHTGITAQLARIANRGQTVPTQKEREKERDRRKELESKKLQKLVSGNEEDPALQGFEESTNVRDNIHSDLLAFYKAQLVSQTPNSGLGDLNFHSPHHFSRISNLWPGASGASKKSKRDKPLPMREAASGLEGLVLHDASSDAAAIERIKKDGWECTLSPAQKLAQPDPSVRFEEQLRPVATLLFTKRAKRCGTCRNILFKPDTKIQSIKYKIKITAQSHIPRLSIRALSPPPTFSSTVSVSSAPFSYSALKSGIPVHFLLHLSNPLFDPIKVTLATPSKTPGKIESRVTILCPQFDVGANTDLYDEVLNEMQPSRGEQQVEAGKIWDKGRNWTTVVIEVVPGFLDPLAGPTQGKDLIKEGQVDDKENEGNEELDEDEDVLEIPIFVRTEFEADVHAEDRGLGDSRGSGKQERENREEAFWTVVGVGRIAPT